MKDITLNDIKNNLPLITRDFKREVKVGSFVFGKELAIIAGPCTVENRKQVFDIAKHVKQSGANFLRGGVFKPLTFPYGYKLSLLEAEKKLAYLKEAGEKYGLPVVSEILYSRDLVMMEKYVDIFQVGYRHMFNMDLIETLPCSSKPILIKRHAGESLRALLGVGEHYESRGKHNILFCERGVSVPHTHNSESRAIIDIQIIPALKEYAPSVPIIVDPSHATFRRKYVPAISMAAVAAGADGILIEVHPNPEKSLIDPLNAIDYDTFERLVQRLNKVRQI